MSKFFKKALSFVVALATAVCVCASCGGNNGGNGGNTSASERESVDMSKTTIRVAYYKAGYGEKWLTELKEAFEKQYAEESFESDKKGVQVLFDNRMDNWTAAQVLNSSYDVFFMESEDLVELRNGGAVEDISDIVVSEGIDGKTIVSKLDDYQKNFFGNGEGKYDGLPRYYGTTGIVYNIDLFEEKELYIGKEGGYVGKNGEKSLGADGLPNTDDDGLPTTYAEFYDLLDQMILKSVVPMCWNGKYYNHYLGYFFDSLVADYEGVDQMMLNYTYDGTATDLVKTENGKVVLNTDGTPATESVSISKTNGYELARQAGKYYAFQFMHKIISDSEYYYEKSFDGNFTQVLSEQEFLQNGYTNNKKKIAMLLEGPWWQNEAAEVFKTMASTDPKYSMTNRRFGWMPLPKATADKVGEESVYADNLNTFVCVRKGTGVLKAAKKFVQFASSDAALTMFTKTTGAPCAYKGYFSDKDKETLSPFSKSVINYAFNAKTKPYYMVSLSKFYNDHYDRLNPLNIYETSIDGDNYTSVPVGIYETYDNVTATSYFENYYKTFMKHSIWNA